VALPEAGRFAATDTSGRFRFDRIIPGRHKVVARTLDGREVSGELEVPGALLDLVMDDGKAPAAARKAGKRG
jgi:hypothetical protein